MPSCEYNLRMARKKVGGPVKPTPEETAEETALLAAVLTGRAGSWAAFYSRYAGLMLSCIRKVMHRYSAAYDDEDLEDMMSTVCLNLVKDGYKKLRAYDATRGYRLSSWVGLIATNTAHDALRRRDPIHISIDDESNSPAGNVADAGVSPSEQLIRSQQAELLSSAIDELDDTDQKFLRYYYLEEREPEEIAELMGVSINTVYSRKHKVREKLRKIIEDQGAA